MHRLHPRFQGWAAVGLPLTIVGAERRVAVGRVGAAVGDAGDGAAGGDGGTGVAGRSWVVTLPHASSQRSLHSAPRSASIGSTCAGAQCIPGPLSRASTTSLFALSTAPLPIGRPAAAKSAYAI